MKYNYNPYLSTQSEVVYEIVKVLRLFSDENLSQDELEETIVAYVKSYARLLFTVKEGSLVLKGFPVQKLGKKRIRIIGACLEKQALIKNYNAETNEFIAPTFLAETA